MIIPDEVRPQYYDNLIGGLSMSLVGPDLLKLIFHVFVVIVGILILSGAVNTSIIGANGVLNRVAEDGVLLEWFRRPQHRFGTTYRIINLIAIAQVITIIGSRGDVYRHASAGRTVGRAATKQSPRRLLLPEPRGPRRQALPSH